MFPLFVGLGALRSGAEFLFEFEELVYRVGVAVLAHDPPLTVG
jgi:hypothetical protein